MSTCLSDSAGKRETHILGHMFIIQSLSHSVALYRMFQMIHSRMNYHHHSWYFMKYFMKYHSWVKKKKKCMYISYQYHFMIFHELSFVIFHEIFHEISFVSQKKKEMHVYIISISFYDISWNIIRESTTKNAFLSFRLRMSQCLNSRWMSQYCPNSHSWVIHEEFNIIRESFTKTVYLSFT